MKPAEANDELRRAASEDSPPTDLSPYLTRLGKAGARTVRFFEKNAKVAAIVWAEGRGAQAYVEIDDSDVSTTPIAAALEDVAKTLQQFDSERRLLLASYDMRLAEQAAEALIDAQERNGPAHAFTRVLETGLVVTFMRPYIDSRSSEKVPSRYHPKDKEDRELLADLEKLRHNYHAHAGQTERRYIIDGSALLGMEAGEPKYAEVWHSLSVDELQRIRDLARRQALRLEQAAKEVAAEAKRSRSALDHER
jgi:hypothetical protein